MDLARDLIRLSGLEEGVDVDIEYSGIRPGEKLYEEVLFGDEDIRPTSHPKVLCTDQKRVNHESLDKIEILVRQAMAEPEHETTLRDLLHSFVPDFSHEDARTNPKTRHSGESSGEVARPKVV